MQKKIILIGHLYHLERQMKGVYDAMEKQFDVKKVFVDDGWPSSINEIPEYHRYDACIWFVRFRELMLKPGFDWADYKGMRIMYDWDANTNYQKIIGDRYLGAWPSVFHRNKFHMLMTTGKECRDLLIRDNVPAYWLPKAYDKALFSNFSQNREGICHFGNTYTARRAMMGYLKNKKIKFKHFRCSHQNLNMELNKFLGCLICNMTGTFILGVGKIINRISPSNGIRLTHGIELMQKNFEAAASGCAPIMDWVEEASDLGFEDGKTAVIYKSFEELVEKLKYYEKHPQALRAIGNNASQLVENNHTWKHRALELDKLISVS